MSKWIALLRAINVGGHTVTMEKLRSIFESMGLKGVETFIASGNVIFDSGATSAEILERRIEERLKASLGYEVATFLRSSAELSAVASYKPFSEPELAAAAALNVAFLAAPLGAAALPDLMSFKTDIDDFHTNGREIYWICKQKQSDSTFSAAKLEKKLRVRTTFRGFNTVLRLAQKYPPAAQPPAVAGSSRPKAKPRAQIERNRKGEAQ